MGEEEAAGPLMLPKQGGRFVPIHSGRKRKHIKSSRMSNSRSVLEQHEFSAHNSVTTDHSYVGVTARAFQAASKSVGGRSNSSRGGASSVGIGREGGRAAKRGLAKHSGDRCGQGGLRNGWA
jgi:hypothetical protein